MNIQFQKIHKNTFQIFSINFQFLIQIIENGLLREFYIHNVIIT